MADEYYLLRGNPVAQDTITGVLSKANVPLSMSGWTVVITGIVVAVIGIIAWIFAPKEDRTVWRSSVSLALALCYIMWAITYLCQLHPLVAPTRSDLRVESD